MSYSFFIFSTAGIQQIFVEFNGIGTGINTSSRHLLLKKSHDSRAITIGLVFPFPDFQVYFLALGIKQNKNKNLKIS